MKEDSIYNYADEIETLSTDDIFTKLHYKHLDAKTRERLIGNMMTYARRKCREQRLICQKDFEQGSVKLNNSILPVIR